MPPPPATPAPRAASCFAKEAVRQGRPEPPPPPFQPHPSLRLRQTKGGVLRSHQPSRTQEFLIGGKYPTRPGLIPLEEEPHGAMHDIARRPLNRIILGPRALLLRRKLVI